MRLRPIHFVPDVDEAVRFYRALGLGSEVRSRSGHWVELSAASGELGLHDAAIAFYCRHLGFHEDMHLAPTFAMLPEASL